MHQVMDLGEDLYERSPERAQAVLERILDRVGVLAELPWSGPPWKGVADPTFRRLVVEDHIVIYRVVESERTVFVLTVRHVRQRPPDPDDLPSR